MSERQARKLRKEHPVEAKASRKKTKAEIMMNVVIVVLVAAILGLGTWAVYSKYQANTANSTNVTDTAADSDTQMQMPTIAEAAEQSGKTTEEYLAEYGLDSREDITGDTELSVAVEYMTLANYAKLSGMELPELREAMGIDESIADDALMSDVYTAMEAAAAEQQPAEETDTAEEAAE